MRYFGSFFITLILYASTITTVLYSFNYQSNNIKNEGKKSLVKISLIEPKVELKKEKRIIKKQKKESNRIEKKIVKKPVKKKIIKKTIKQKTKLEKEFEHKTQKINHLPKKKDENIIHTLPKVDIERIKNDFIIKVKKTINKNKFYPNSARRRGIEGDVNVNFTIGKQGELKDFKILKGKKIFFKAVTQAIEKSFPIYIEKNNLFFPINIDLCIKYNLN